MPDGNFKYMIFVAIKLFFFGECRSIFRSSPIDHDIASSISWMKIYKKIIH